MSASILLVDDEVGITNSLKRVLRKDGYALEAVDNAHSALELLERRQFDLVISDQRMPTMTGSALLAEVNRLYPTTSRILFSGYCDFAALSEAVNDAAVQRFLLKPWVDSEIRQEVRHVLDESIFERNIRDNMRFSMELQEELSDALKVNQLFNYLQPIINTQTNQLYAAEMQIRWHHPERGLLSANDFFPLTQHSQAIRDIGLYQFEYLLSYVSRLIGQFRVCMNVSPAQLDSAGFFKKLESFCAKLGDSAEKFVLEITETELTNSIVGISGQLQKLKTHGVKIALDDFCTSYSSIHYLKSLPVDIVKIDKTFIWNIDTDSRNQFVVSSIIDLADKFGVEIIAEGVEKPEQVTKLNELGCYLHQGYLYGKPKESYVQDDAHIYSFPMKG